MRNRIDTPWDAFTRADLRPDDRVAPNFKIYELTKSDIANRYDIDNSFESDAHLRAAVYLTRNVLQPIRDHYGSFSPNSVYRGQTLERALKRKPAGWISSSQHTLGCACDVEIVGTPTLSLAAWAAQRLPAFDQVICECYDARQGTNSGWVHISLKAPGMGENRGRKLSYVRDPGSERMVYIDGLHGQPVA